MGEPGKGIELDYERIEKAFKDMGEALETFKEENKKFFQNEVECLNQMNSNYVEQQRKILECFMYQAGAGLVSNIEDCCQGVWNDYNNIKQKDENEAENVELKYESIE